MEAILRPIDEIEPTQNGALHWSWEVHDNAGTRLARLGSVHPPLDVATASLRADHGYPPGDWTPEGDGYRYVPAGHE